MMRIRGRFALLVATAAVLPLVVFGLVALSWLRTGTRQSVAAGNVAVANRAAEQIEQYLGYAMRTLQTLAADLEGTALEPWQQERILRNYVLAFPMFREISLFDGHGRVIASSRLTTPALTVPDANRFDDKGISLSPITVDDDLLPRTTLSARVAPDTPGSATLVSELRLEEMWRLVDQLRVGTQGFALLADRERRLIAHGNPDEKAAVARGEDLRSHPLAGMDTVTGAGRPAWLEYQNTRGVEVLGVAATVPNVAWTLVIEQSTAEAYALLRRLERQLLLSIALALFITVAAGYYWGRSFIRPITALLAGTKALAAGRLDTRVHIERDDEFATLGDGFNSMADSLVMFQHEVRRQERQALLGRIAAGLVHDLSHPIQNIANSCRLILKMHDDPEYHETFRRTVERELSTVKRFFEDLRNLARPIPLERFTIDLGRAVGEAVESMRTSAESAGLALSFEPPPEAVAIDGDSFALGRVYRNLILNAIQATAPGGAVRVQVAGTAERARVTVADSGCGIPPDRLQAIFEDFTTTKRRGLGLGLPISKKIVEQLGGSIAVSSVVGDGTTVTIEFPRTTIQSIPVAAHA
ncbi:MAG: ATP-binding protein [Vicinamibacterales bacterium]